MGLHMGAIWRIWLNYLYSATMRAIASVAIATCFTAAAAAAAAAGLLLDTHCQLVAVS